VTAPITAHPRPSESPSASIRANKDRVTIEVLPPHTALTAYGTAGPPDTSFPHIATTHEPPE
ncbi:MAG: hypothetical protein QOE30_1351, partial [Mycobacterium sp.]|uniref:hypothetical protein n=1 Tax=Mycobacterium sp. TaxID=1785 RepID=UPI0028B4F910